MSWQAAGNRLPVLILGLLVTTLSGCVSEGEPPADSPLTTALERSPDLNWRWSVNLTTDDGTVFLQIPPGGPACWVDSRIEGRLDTESGLGHLYSDWNSYGVVSLGMQDGIPRVQGGPLRTGTINTYAGPISPVWSSTGRSEIGPDGTDHWSILRAFQGREIIDAEKHSVSVECAGLDPGVRVYFAETWLPITAGGNDDPTGVAAKNPDRLNTGVEIVRGSWSIVKSRDLVLMTLGSFSNTSALAHQGTIRLSTPTETTEHAVVKGELFFLYAFDTMEGEYRLEVEDYVNTDGTMVGAMADLRLVHPAT